MTPHQLKRAEDLINRARALNEAVFLAAVEVASAEHVDVIRNVTQEVEDKLVQALVELKSLPEKENAE